MSGRKTKYIKSKFFFIKNRVDKREIKVIVCPAKEMWADMLTKPLLGMAFRKMYVKLMNCPVNYDEDKKSEFDLAKQNRRTTKMGTRTATKQVASISPQECVEHKQFRATAKDRPVGVARTKLT